MSGDFYPAPGVTPADQWVACDAGLRRWRPVIDAIEVTALPGGERSLRIAGVTIRLPADLARHLGRLLIGDPQP